MILLAAIVASLLLGSSVVAVPAAAEDPAASITFDGSVEYLASGTAGKVIVHVAGVTGNYSYNVSVNGGSVTPTKGTSSAENFTVTVTAPSTTGDVVLTTVINGTSNATAKYTIKVIKPVVLSATVKNTGNLTLQNLPVRFLVDDVVVNETTFTIAANSTKTLTYNWTAPNLASGTHTLKVVLDPDNENVRFIDGATTFTTSFYVGESSWGLINVLLVVVVAVLFLLLFFGYMNKGRKRKT